MKYILFLITGFLIQFNTLPAFERAGFILQKDVAQYKGSDYTNLVHVERHITLEEAFNIAEQNSEIDYFVYTKGSQMVLEIPSDVEFNHLLDPFGLVSQTSFRYDSGQFGHGYCRIFRRGDALFFKKEGICLTSAPGLADAYIKQ